MLSGSGVSFSRFAVRGSRFAVRGSGVACEACWTSGRKMRYHYALLLEVAPVANDKPAQDRWEQLNKCPECGNEMQRDAAVGEKIGLFYRCPTHGRFRYSWDNDRLERE